MSLPSDVLHFWFGQPGSAIRGTFREEPISIVANGDQVAALMAQQAERDGVQYHWRTVQWWRVADGKAAEFIELVDDHAAFEAVWRKP